MLRAAIAVLVLVLGGCASFSPDGGMESVSALAKERGAPDVRWLRTDGDASRAREAVTKLLAGPLTAETAVRIALLNNRGLQATYAELGIAESDVVQAGRLRNPGFSIARLRRGGEIEIERAFLADLLGLVTMPLRTRLEERRFRFTQSRVASEVIQVAADTRRAYFAALSARQGVTYMTEVKDTAEAGAELARRMAAAGNFSKLDQAREQVFYAETTAQLARVTQAAVAERERLTRLMGLWGDETGFSLPERLPDLPREVADGRDIEAKALSTRLDVRASLDEAQQIASSLGLTRATGFISVLELGYMRNSETGQPRQTGYEIEVRLPLFDWDGARTARAEHTYMQAVNRAADLAVRARSEVREAYRAYRTAYDLARHYRDEIVPLRKRIAEENVLRYNGMLVSVFELLADARQQVTSVNAYIEALRDFWIAEATLQLATAGRSPGTTGGARAAIAAPASAAGGH